jgi:segregation and condensation protein A
MSVNIKIENFEGPFDILLHLIKKNEMDIYDIKINEITEQYMQVLREMEEMDLEITSEFIVIAATLIEIKSRQLLPKVEMEDESIADNLDPTKQLVEKLVEYKKYKAAALFFQEAYEKTGMSFSKKPEVIVVEDDNSTEELFKNKSIAELYEIFLDLMERYMSKINTNSMIEEKVYIDTYKLEDKMKVIDEYLSKKKIIPFSEIINKCSTKIEKVVTFLALLELIRLRTISALQENNFNEIYIERMNNIEEYKY